MKKIFISLSLLIVSSFAFGQSILLEPASLNKRFSVKTDGYYGYFSTSSASDAELVFLRNALASGTGSEGFAIGKIATTAFGNHFNIGTSNFNTNGSFNLRTLDVNRITIKNDGLVGIGTTNPNSLLHINEPTLGFIQAMQITTDATGSTATDGLGFSIFSSSDLVAPRAARIMNNENAQLYFGANNMNVMNITPTGNVGINSFLGSAPSARFQVFHDTQNDATKPHINLVTAVDANFGMIKMTNIGGSRYFGQYFRMNSTTPANNFISFDYNGTTPILDLKGNGNIEVAGFTKLGDDVAAPKVKMKKLSGTFSANANTLGTATNIAHGVANPSKIISINVLGQYAGSGGFVSNSFLTSNGYQFDYQVDGVNIIVTPKQGNSSSLVSQNIKIVISYEE